MIIPFLVESSRHSFSSAWLKRAYQRAKEEAEEEGKSLADVVAKRYGVSHIQFKVHLTPKFFFGQDETLQHSHKDFDNIISIWYF